MIEGRARVRDLLRSPGSTTQVDGTVPVGSAGLTSAHLEGDAAYGLTLEAEGGRIHATGTARARWVGECRRCLEPTAGEIVAPVAEIFEAYPTEGETWPIDDGEIDLTEALTQALVLELPLAPLCRDDCAGPDPERFPAEPETDADEAAEPPADPRWAALEGLELGDPDGAGQG